MLFKELLVRYLFFVLLSLWLCGCVGVGGESAQSSSHSNIPAQDPCAAPVDAELTDIASVVAWINAMPKPLTLPCFVASLPRPIFYNATTSPISAQPSIGEDNPRIFIKARQLLLSYVTQERSLRIEDPVTGETTSVWDADGVQLLELSYEVPSEHSLRQSIKGELAFPIRDQLPANAPYAHINNTKTASICGGCHNNEVVVATLDGVPVFRSAMLRNPFTSEVDNSYLLNQYATCNPEGGPQNAYRCQMFEATFGHGTMLWLSFPDDIPTFF